MRRFLFPAVALAAVLVAGVLVYPRQAGATPDYNQPRGAYGNVTLAPATATKIPAAPLNGRNGLAIANLDAQPIYIGFNSSVTNLTGFPVASMGSVALELSYNGNIATPARDVYAYSVSGQVAGTDTRWMEVK